MEPEGQLLGLARQRAQQLRFKGVRQRCSEGKVVWHRGTAHPLCFVSLGMFCKIDEAAHYAAFAHTPHPDEVKKTKSCDLLV